MLFERRRNNVALYYEELSYSIYFLMGAESSLSMLEETTGDPLLSEDLHASLLSTPEWGWMLMLSLVFKNPQHFAPVPRLIPWETEALNSQSALNSSSCSAGYCSMGSAASSPLPVKSGSSHSLLLSNLVGVRREGNPLNPESVNQSRILHLKAYHKVFDFCLSL